MSDCKTLNGRKKVTGSLERMLEESGLSPIGVQSWDLCVEAEEKFCQGLSFRI